MLLRVLLVASCAGLMGVGFGLLVPADAPPERRPPELETALRAVDAWERTGDRTGVVEAARRLDGLPGLTGPWRDEADLVACVGSGDETRLWRFATEGRRGAARARALLLLRSRTADPVLASRATARLREDYPASWAALAPERGDR